MNEESGAKRRRQIIGVPRVVLGQWTWVWHARVSEYTGGPKRGVWTGQQDVPCFGKAQSYSSEAESGSRTLESPATLGQEMPRLIFVSFLGESCYRSGKISTHGR